MIVVEGGGHLDAITLAQASAALSELLANDPPEPEIPSFAILLSIFAAATILLVAAKKQVGKLLSPSF